MTIAQAFWFEVIRYYSIITIGALVGINALNLLLSIILSGFGKEEIDVDSFIIVLALAPALYFLMYFTK